MKGQLRILSMYAFIAMDEDGTEGVVGAMVGGRWLPLVGADLAMAQKLRPLAELTAKQTGVPVTLAHFSVRTDQELIAP